MALRAELERITIGNLTIAELDELHALERTLRAVLRLRRGWTP
jgi:hypothetical protein